MKRGDLVRVRKPDGDPKQSRVFVVMSRPALIASRFSTVIGAPIYTSRHGLATELNVGIDEGLEHESSVHRDALVSLPKAMLTDFVGSLSLPQLARLDSALRIAVHVE